LFSDFPIPTSDFLMRYMVLATDYDGTIAHHGSVDAQTIAALERCRGSGRKLVLVTGRVLDELMQVCPRLDLFEWVVAENGALLYQPESRMERPLADPPPPRLVETLSARGVKPISVGRVIVATWEPHEAVVLETIRDLALELQVIFNKGAVMVLPTGVNKASGLTAALDELRISPHNVVAIGDAENDHALLSLCEASAAVANALDTVKEHVDFLTPADHGPGVAQLIDKLLADDLAELAPRLERHHILLGHSGPEQEVRIDPYRTNLLVAGTSGSGKSTIAIAFLERLAQAHYQFCVIDPEGDYQDLDIALSVGTAQQPPDLGAVLQLLEKPNQNVVVNLVGIPVADRPAFFLMALSRLYELRARIGKPHWIVVDEAHHVLPAEWTPGTLVLPQQMTQMMLITVHPNHVAAGLLTQIDIALAIGKEPRQALQMLADAKDALLPEMPPVALERGDAIVWQVESDRPPFLMKVAPGKLEHRRHHRKYAEGELEPDRSFYFRGPEEKLNLRAQNLVLFVQLAEGVDDETWMHHLQRGDYSRWLREGIKDEELAEEVAELERQPGAPAESREQIKSLINERYTLPASAGKTAEKNDAVVAARAG
jgi:hydroxymethylpyrimidine pyrophosphatase-like HAD family hydrolase